jgi:hypothetical protein
MANVPISNLTTTWNNVSTTFTGIKLNVTDTASAEGSLLMNLQVGGGTRAQITKTGRLFLSGSASGAGDLFFFNADGSTFAISASGFGGTPRTVFKSASVRLPSDGSFSFTNSTNANGAPDCFLVRDAADTLAQRNGVNAQTHRLYGTYTDGSNYRRLTKTMSTGGVAEIKPEGAGTGASGNVLHISGLPTSNPGPGILWNNLGIVNVGT